jgi:hypothetical protein
MADKNKKSGTNWLIWLIIIGVGFWIYKHYINSQQVTITYAKDFKNSLITFEKEKEETKEEVQKALKAYEEAKDVLFKYQDKRTQDFIKRWKRAESKVNDLIDAYNNLIRKANNFFEVLYNEAEKIKDERLRSQVIAFINERKEQFYAKAERAKEGIIRLRNLMQKGDDLIKAIEIAGALKYSEIGSYNFNDFQYQLDRSFTELNSLIEEGKSIVSDLSQNKIKVE